jgi:hypothetical protein
MQKNSAAPLGALNAIAGALNAMLLSAGDKSIRITIVTLFYCSDAIQRVRAIEHYDREL